MPNVIKKRSDKYTLKNENKAMSRLNVVVEVFDVEWDGTATTMVLPTDLHTVLEFSVVQTSTVALYAPAFHSDLNVSSGTLTITGRYISTLPSTGTAFPNTAKHRVTVKGLST